MFGAAGDRGVYAAAGVASGAYGRAGPTGMYAGPTGMYAAAGATGAYGARTAGRGHGHIRCGRGRGHVHQRTSNEHFRTSMYGNRSLMSHRLTSTYDVTPNV